LAALLEHAEGGGLFVASHHRVALLLLFVVVEVEKKGRIAVKTIAGGRGRKKSNKS